MAGHALGEFPHSDDPLDDPRSFGAKRLQPSRCLAVRDRVLQKSRQGPDDGADLDLVGALKAIRL